MPLVSTGIINAYLGSSTVSSIYLGTGLIFPFFIPAFWSNFNPNSCATLNITSSLSLNSALNWGDGSVSGIASGNGTYKHSYGTGVC